MKIDLGPVTAPMQFDQDSPGVFVRGNHAFACGVGLAMLLQRAQGLNEEHRKPLEQLRDALLAVDAEDEPEDLQKMKPFKDCRAG